MKEQFLLFPSPFYPYPLLLLTNITLIAPITSTTSSSFLILHLVKLGFQLGFQIQINIHLPIPVFFNHGTAGTTTNLLSSFIIVLVIIPVIVENKLLGPLDLLPRLLVLLLLSSG